MKQIYGWWVKTYRANLRQKKKVNKSVLVLSLRSISWDRREEKSGSRWVCMLLEDSLESLERRNVQTADGMEKTITLRWTSVGWRASKHFIGKHLNTVLIQVSSDSTAFRACWRPFTCFLTKYAFAIYLDCIVNFNKNSWFSSLDLNGRIVQTVSNLHGSSWLLIDR